MIKHRSGLERFILCALTYLVFVFFSYEKVIFGGIFYQISKIFICIFIGVLLFQSFIAGKNNQWIFLGCQIIALGCFVIIFEKISSTSQIGFSLWQLNQLFFDIPLRSYTSISSLNLLLISCISFVIGRIVKIGLMQINDNIAK